MKLHFEIVTPEAVAYQDKIDQLTVETESGEITILPKHTPLVSILRPGEMRIKKGSEETVMAVAGGFVEVQPESKVIILADSAVRADEIDEVKAEEARRRAEQLLSQKTQTEATTDLKAELAHALAQLKVARRRSKK